MLAVIRLLGLGVMFLFLLFYTILVCLLRPFHPNNVQAVANMLGRLGCWIMNIKVEARIPDSTRNGGPMVYVANHQNSYDIFTLGGTVLPGTVSIGKKSLKWIPAFGQIYWLTGNIMIDRKNSSSARNTLGDAIEKMRSRNISIWFFPEGTRSNGRGLLPFKTGAFHTALQANVPLVTVSASNNCGQIKMNKWNNGKVIVQMSEPQTLCDADKKDIRQFTKRIHSQMADQIATLNDELGQSKETNA